MGLHGIIIIFIIIFVVRCNSQYIMEDEYADLYFPYPCDSARVTLQYRTRMPFYSLADLESLSLPPEHANRFIVQNNNESNACSLHLRITLVKRTDAGTYISLAYANDGTTTIERIGLNVDFLPGKASCTMGEESTVGNWVALNCMAPVGSLSGQIDCFQNGEKMPPITEPTETYKHLKQTIIVKKNHLVFCCTSTWEHTKDLCDCNDCQWDLANDTNLSSVIDPCGLTTLSQDQTKTGETPFIPSNATSVSTEATIFKINDSHGPVIWTIVVFILSSIVIIGLVILVIVLKLRSKKQKREAAKKCTCKNQNQSPFKLYEPMPNPNERQCMLHVQRSMSAP